MKALATRVSRMKDGQMCLPSEGYDRGEFEIERDEFIELYELPAGAELPPADQPYPKCAPDENLVKVGRRILQKVVPAASAKKY